MILPTKHLSISNSLLNLGAIILKNLTKEKTVSALWNDVRKNQEINSFDQFLLSLDFLFILDAIDYDKENQRIIKK
jgi:hypothetical protein